MALSRQVACPPGSIATIADPQTLQGGTSVTLLNSHATEPLYIGGDENQLAVGGGTTLSATSGLRIAAGKYLHLVLDGNETVYGISGTSTVTISCHVFSSTFRSTHGAA